MNILTGAAHINWRYALAVLVMSVAVVLSALFALTQLNQGSNPAPARVHVIERVIEKPVVQENAKVVETEPYGDDNHDGVIDEDETGWDAELMGNGEYTGDRYPNDPTR